MLGVVVNALMAHVWSDSMALVVDALMNRAGAVSRALAAETPSTHTGTDSMVLNVDIRRLLQRLMRRQSRRFRQ